MCGLYAILDTGGKGLDYTDEDIAQEMGIITQLRGRHSSGIFVVDGKSVNKRPRIVKALGPSNNLEWERNYEGTMKIVRSTASAIVGHGRYATSGKITKENAHPFHHQGVTLVHNGTIRSGLEEEMKETEVDSHALTKVISDKGMIDALHAVQGAYAIILHNMEDGKVYIARNHERTLFYVETMDRVFIMSDPGALEYLNRRKNLFGTHRTVNSFTPGMVYAYDPVEGKLVAEEELKKPVVHYSYPPPVKQTTYGSYNKPVTPSEPFGNDVTTVKAAAYKKGEDVEFIVRAIFLDSKDGLWNYKAADYDGNHILFKTTVYNPDWNGRTGVGPVVATHLAIANGEQSKWSYQIRARNITWEQDVVEDNVETSDCVITAKEWKTITADGKCISCENAIDPDYPEDTYIQKKGDKWVCLCPSCLGHMLDTKQIEKIAQAARYLN